MTGQLLVSFPDCTVMNADPSIQKLLGYSSKELEGNNIRLLCGPLTNIDLLQSCIFDLGTPSPTQLLLYNKQLTPTRIMIHASANGKTDPVNNSRSLLLSKSQALSVLDTVESNDDPRVITTSNPPYLMALFNDTFSATFGIDRDILISSPSSPITIVAGPRETVASWTQPFLVAAAGSVCESIIYTRTAFCADYSFKLRCEPVVLSENGKIALVAATFLSLMPNSQPDVRPQNFHSISPDIRFYPFIPGSSGYDGQSGGTDSDGARTSAAFQTGALSPVQWSSNHLPDILSAHPASGFQSRARRFASAYAFDSTSAGGVRSDSRAALISADMFSAFETTRGSLSSHAGDQASLAPLPKRRRAGRPQRGDDVAALLVRGDHTLLRRIRRRHAAADRRTAELDSAEPPL